jgi:hypothetical protein
MPPTRHPEGTAPLEEPDVGQYEGRQCPLRPYMGLAAAPVALCDVFLLSVGRIGKAEG